MPAYYEHFRAGSGSPVVLLHGACSSWSIWGPTLDPLSSHHEVYALTMAGHRGGPPLDVHGHQVRVSTFVDDLERQLDLLGLGSAHLVGNSLGGRVSLELLRRGRALSVTAFSPAAAWRSDSQALRVSVKHRVALLASRIPGPRWLARRSPMMRRTLNRLVMEHGERTPITFVDDLLRDLHQTREWISPFGRNNLADGHMAPIEIGATPVCVAWGTKDRVIPFRGFGEPLRELLPGARFVDLPGCGHVPMWDDSDLVVRTILETTGQAAAERAG